MNLGSVNTTFFTFLSTNSILNQFFDIKDQKSQIDNVQDSKLIVYIISEDKIYARAYIINILNKHDKSFIPIDISLLTVIQTNLLQYVGNFQSLNMMSSNPLTGILSNLAQSAGGLNIPAMFINGINPLQMLNPTGLNLNANTSHNDNTRPSSLSNLNVTPSPTPLPNLDATPVALPLPNLDATPVALPLPNLDATPVALPLPNLDATPVALPLPNLDVTPVALPLEL